MQVNRYAFLLLLVCVLTATNAAASVKGEIYKAAKSGNTRLLQRYLAHGYSIDTPDSDGVTALCEARLDRNYKAYNLLLKYGASPYAKCMSLSRSQIDWSKYAIGGAVTAGVVGVAAAVGGGGGGGGSSGGDNGASGTIGGGSGSSGGYTPYNPANPSSFTAYSTADFLNDTDFRASSFGGGTLSNGKKTVAVNFLGGINAASAYSKFYGHDNSGNLVSLLSRDIIVAVIDDGVWGNNNEFKTTNGTSKVFTGHNFDYGPCRGGDTKNCWHVVSNSCSPLGKCTEVMVLNDANGAQINQTRFSTSYLSSDAKTPFEIWSEYYPDDYDWDVMQNTYTPLSGKNSYLHGTNVAGIIAANWNKGGYGMTGVAFTNTKIDAVRWDLYSSLSGPMQAVLNDGAKVINLSLGTVSSSDRNATKINSMKNYLSLGYLDAMDKVRQTYTYSGGKIDGPIIVKAAGNEAQSQPDLESGVKNLSGYNDLLMLVVTSVDVKLNADGSVQSYSKSSFANSCGAAASYCIAAPGGNETSTQDFRVYSAGSAPNSYVGMRGTSQATPVVSGSVAFLLSAYEYMTASEAILLLRQTANTTAADYFNYSGDGHSDTTYGAGLLDLGAAVNSYISPVSGTSSLMTVAGDNVNSELVQIDTASLNLTAAVASAVKDALPEKLTVFDYFHRPFDVATQNYISVTHSGYSNLKRNVNNIRIKAKKQSMQQDNMTFSYAESLSGKQDFGFIAAEYKHGKHTDGFYFSEDTKFAGKNNISAEHSNPFMAFTSAYGMQHKYAFNRFSALKFETIAGQNGIYDGTHDLQDDNFKQPAYGFNSELQFKLNKRFNLSFSGGMLYEDEALLGMNGRGAFAVKSGQTFHNGVTANWQFSPRLSFSGSYYQGYTKAQRFASNLLKTGNIISDSFAISADYKWDNTLNFALGLSSPLRVKHGALYVDFPAGRDNYSDQVYRHTYKAGLKPVRREYRLALSADKEVSDDLSWRTEFAVRFNPEHQRAANDHIALFGLNWNF